MVFLSMRPARGDSDLLDTSSGGTGVEICASRLPCQPLPFQLIILMSRTQIRLMDVLDSGRCTPQPLHVPILHQCSSSQHSMIGGAPQLAYCKNMPCATLSTSRLHCVPRLPSTGFQELKVIDKGQDPGCLPQIRTRTDVVAALNRTAEASRCAGG